MKKTNDFGRDPIPRLVLKISIPFMFAQFVNVLYSIVDRIYIGKHPCDRCGFSGGSRGLCADHYAVILFWDAGRYRRLCPFFCASGSRR